MISLPRNPRRGGLRAFCLSVAGLLEALAVPALFLAAGAPHGAIGLVSVVLALLVGLLRPAWVRPVFGWWNRTADRCSRVSTNAVVAVGYYFVVTPARLFSPMSAVSGNGDWVPRVAQPPTTYFRPDLAPGKPGQVVFFDLLRWSMASGNVWTTALLPFVGLLRLLDAPREERTDPLAGHNVYTLY